MTCPNATTPRYARTKPTWKMDRVELAKVVAGHVGVHSHPNGGGWLYFRGDTVELPLIQGWDNYGRFLERSGAIVVGRGVNWTLVPR